MKRPPIRTTTTPTIAAVVDDLCITFFLVVDYYFDFLPYLTLLILLISYRLKFLKLYEKVLKLLNFNYFVGLIRLCINDFFKSLLYFPPHQSASLLPFHEPNILYYYVDCDVPKKYVLFFWVTTSQCLSCILI